MPRAFHALWQYENLMSNLCDVQYLPMLVVHNPFYILHNVTYNLGRYRSGVRTYIVGRYTPSICHFVSCILANVDTVFIT